MIESVFSQLRFAYSILTGRHFSVRGLERVAKSLVETQAEFGPQSADKGVLSGPLLDPEAMRVMQLRRFKMQAVRARSGTDHYKKLFERININCEKLSLDDITRIPLTSSDDIREMPESFVHCNAKPAFRTTTTGTTGKPTSVLFSKYEMDCYAALGAIGLLHSGKISSEDSVLLCSSSRAMLGNECAYGSYIQAGVLVCHGGLVDPKIMLARLTQKLNVDGKKNRFTLLVTYPSYLGQLIETAIEEGYKPDDFGLRRIFCGGEIVTEGLKRRARKVLGEVAFDTDFGMTEIWPMTGQHCEQNHMHFDASMGLVEVCDPETHESLYEEGKIGVLVATPFPPFRETTLVLRYNTQDMVRIVPQSLTCTLAHIPAVSNILGKYQLSIRHETGWVTVRDIAEALEDLDEIPLPARYSFWERSGGVIVEVVTRSQNGSIRNKIEHRLLDCGIPVRELMLHSDKSKLQKPIPLRGDLRELSFSAT